MGDWLFLIPLLPLLGVLANGLLSPKLWPHNEKLTGAIASLTVLGSFVVGLLATRELAGSPAGTHRLVDTLFTWIAAGSLEVQMGFALDRLSAVMVLVVSGVGFLIHVYSVGYMHGERGYRRFFTYLNLFVAAMLILVLGDNFLVMFVGWEGVGLCSYLLIGYYYEKKSAADAGKKAFVVNRIGDFGFLLAIFLIFYSHGTLDFEKVATHMQGAGPSLAITVITLLLFLGATGKSAQIPLYFWLPDAMEGPTPVSALIHAATMVTAGVYMVARTNFFFSLAPLSQAIVATVGCLTAFFAATMAFAQRDIKRILAYSTISQLGYMFMGVGIGAYAAGIFHLMTHAFFKALLFMGAGSIMHALHGELDVYKMGGLRKHMPATFWTFLLATIAIAGIPPFAGFFSKDEILWKVFSNHLEGIPTALNAALYTLALLTAGMTAFYMFRAVFLAFFGESRMAPEVEAHVHESPKVMTVPLMILALLSVIGGLIGIPRVLGGGAQFEAWLAPMWGHETEAAVHESGSLELSLMIVSVGVAVLGIFLAFVFYRLKTELPGRFVASWPRLYQTVWHKYYVDEFNDRAVVNPLKRVSTNFLWSFVDVVLVDGAVNGVAGLAKVFSGWFVKIQTGRIYAYALSILIGAAVILGFVLWHG